MSNKSRALVLLLSTPVLAFVVLGYVMGGTASGQDYQHLVVFRDVVSLILNNYVEEVDVDKVMTGALKGLADGLDADSAFLVPSDVRAMDSKLTPPGGDVGLTLTRQYYLRIVAARDGSAAARAGLRTGDYVRMIDGRPTRDLSVFEGARLLAGAPGTKVSLVVIRGNAADPHSVDLVREPAPKEPIAIASRIAAPGVGYLRIPAFSRTTAPAMTRAVTALSKQGATKLVIDLRQSAEGPLEAGIETARGFVAGGTLAIRAGRTGVREEIKATAGADAIALPVALLVNGGTSGAAELFAAALVGNKRAELVGEPTHGRAGIQKLVRLPEGHGLWLTHAAYLTPAGEAIHEKGLKPTVNVEEPDVEFGAQPDPAKGDPILEKALEKLGARKAA